MNQNPIILAKKRTVMGRASANQVRREGSVPAVVYGKDETTEHLEVDGKSLGAFFRKLKPGYLPTTRLTLKRTDQGQEQEVIVKEIEYDKIFSDRIIHMAFKTLKKGQSVNVLVPIALTGGSESPGVKAGGELVRIMTHVPVTCPADAIPVDAVGHVSHLEMKQGIKVKELKNLEGVKLRCDKEQTIAKIAKRS